jgi:hypothetical protein
MLDLKDGSSPDIKQKHYENVISSMMDGLNATLDKEPKQDEYDIDSVDPEGYSFKTNVSWEDTVK